MAQIIMDHKITLSENHNSEIQTSRYREAIFQKEEIIWNELGKIQVGQALENWLGNLGELTQKTYRTSLQRIIELGLFSSNANLQEFSLTNHERIVDEIKAQKGWSEATRQARAAAYISFTGFLQRRTQGMIRKAQPNKEGMDKTFFKVRDKVKTNPLSRHQTSEFLKILQSLNPRDALIAKLLLQGGKRKGEVLALEIASINFQDRQITYTQSKTKGLIKETVITYPAHVMDELRAYTLNRSGLCFVTRNNNKIAPFQIDRNFKKAGEMAGIPFTVSPHVLRVTLVTRLKELKVQDSDIMKITGHASPAQLISYDRTDRADNASADFDFV